MLFVDAENGRVPEHRLFYELFNNDAIASKHKNTSVPKHKCSNPLLISFFGSE